MNKVAVIGMAGNSAFLSVDHFHRPEETLSATAIHFEPGGKGFNQAVAAARYQAEVSFLCAVGKEYQQEIRQFLLDNQIAPLLVQKEDATAFASILTNRDGENQVTVYQGARLEPEDVTLFSDQIAEADILLLNNEVPLSVNIRAIEIAKQHSTFVILNPAPAAELPPEILNGTDLFTPNEQEAPFLPESANRIITQGSRGCLNCATGQFFPALQVPSVVDTTGAGDTFSGVLAARLAASISPEAAIREAIHAAGVSVTRKYAATAIPTAAEVADYIQTINKKENTL